ncbi:MAG TPA: fibronectin type III domain-containing protein [Longimicrobium sp.]|nr:fibronectin type III domain-containing protein [Longimicrobium sp.]
MTNALRRWIAPSVLLAMTLAACGGDGGTEPQPLAAPTGVTGTAGSQQVTLSWQAVADADAYTVQRAAGTGTFADVGTTPQPSYTDTGLSASTTYRYRVFATRGAEVGPASVVTITTSNLPVVLVGNDITASRTFHRDSVYRLTNFIHVGNGARLTVQAGARIEGEQGSALFILRGASIEAVGTAAQPIVFTSSRDVGSRQPGDWGGLVIIGGGTINRSGEIILEGTGTSSTNNPALAYSGGTAAGDAGSSGRLSYVRIEFAGFGPAPNQELNSLTLAAVGSGTTIDHVQTLAGLDDSFEWFGGTVDAKYLVSYESGDDHFDASEGFRGRVQHMIAYQDTVLPPRAFSGNLSSDPQGIENDGCDAGTGTCTFNSTPLTTPMFANFTVVGTGPGVVPSGGGIGMLLRRGAGGYYVNGVIARWPNAAMSIRDQATWDRVAAGSLVVRSLLLAENARTFTAASGQFPAEADSAATKTAWSVQHHAGTMGSLFTAFPARPAAPSPATMDWTPAAGSPAATGGTGAFTGTLAAIGGTFVTGTDYRGAAAPGGEKWWQGWTNYARR